MESSESPNSVPRVEPTAVPPVPDVAVTPTSAIGATTAMSVGEPVWRYLHISSLVFEITSRIRQFLFPLAVGTYSLAQAGWVAASIGTVILASMLAFAVVRYFTRQYCLADGELRVREGWLFRSLRTVPTHRIQNIDIVQNVLHRILGVAEVRVETAGGKEPEAVLKVLKLADVEWLRNEVFRMKAGGANPSHTHPDSSAEATEDAQTSNIGSGGTLPSFASAARQPVLLEIPLRRLTLAGLISDRGWLIVPIVIGFLYEFRGMSRFVGMKWKFGQPDVNNAMRWFSLNGLLVALAILLAAGVLLKLFAVIWYILRFYGYRLTINGNDLRVTCGLLTKVAATIPRNRIQFISIHRSWLGRKLGLAAIRIETAGAAGKEDMNATESVSSRWFIPVISESDVVRIMAELRVGLDWKEAEFPWQPLSQGTARRMCRSILVVTMVATIAAAILWSYWFPAIGLLVAPLLMWYAAKKAKSMRYARRDDCIVFRSGMFTKKISCTFFDKLQTVKLSQTPFDRRWQMATLSLDTASAGPAEHRIHVHYMDAAYARDEFLKIQLMVP